MSPSFAHRTSRKPQHVLGRAAATPLRTIQTPPGGMLYLQRTAGNQAVTRLLQRAAAPGTMTVQDGRSGEPLDQATRLLMESRLGHDFSKVRIHTDPDAVQSARDINATAFTVGYDVVLGASTPSLNTENGQRLLAHELAHVVQQQSSSFGASKTGLDAEREADTAATATMAGKPFTPQVRTGVTLARQGPGNPPTASPLSLPAEGVDMPWRGTGTPSSELGYLRDRTYFWSRFQAAYGERLSLDPPSSL